MSSKRPINKGSMLLSEDENSKLFQLLGNDNYTLSSTGAQMISTKRNKSPRWREIGQGIVCVVKSYSVKKYFLRLFDVHNGICIGSQEISDNFCLIQHSHFTSTAVASVTFVDDEYIYCLNFSHSVEEANHLTQTVLIFLTVFQGKKVDTTANDTCHKCHSENLFLDSLIDHNDSESSESFKQPCQTAVLKNKKPDIDENLKCLLEQIGMSPDNLNKNEREIVDKIVETYGGMETVTAELNRNPATSSIQSSHAKKKDSPSVNNKYQPLPSFIKSFNDVKDVLQVAVNDLNCCICCKTSVEPILCSNCNLIIGCKSCVNEWNSRSLKRTCPLCRGFNLFLEIRGLTALGKEIRQYEESNL